MANDLWRAAGDRFAQRNGLAGAASPRLGASMVPALDANPDEVGKARDLARRSGLSVPEVEVDPEGARRAATLREADLQNLGQRAPATARLFEDPQVAQVAHDDIRNMGALERYVRDIGQDFQRGQRLTELGPLGFEAIWGDDAVREFRIRQLEAKDAADVDYGLDESGVDAFFKGIPGAVAESLPMLGSSIVSAGEGGVAGAAGGAAVGLVAGAPGGPGGAVGGAVAGGTAGFATGATLGLYMSAAKMEAGLAYLDLRKISGVDAAATASPNAAYFNSWHQKVMASGRALQEGDQTTTMRIASFGIDGKTYLIPTYDPETGKVLPDDQAVAKAMPAIRSGQLKPYDSVAAAEADRQRFYPAIVAGEQPIDPKLAGTVALSVGATAGAVEMWGLGKLMEKIPGVRRLTGAGMREAAKGALQNPNFRRFAGQLVGTATGSAATEGLTEGAQEAIAIVGELAGLASKGKGLEDFTFESPGPDGQPIVLRGTDAILARVMFATSKGAQMGAGIATGGRLAQGALESERAKKALAKVESITRLGKTVDESKLRERDPETFKRHAREVASAAKVENVYVPSEEMRTYFEHIPPEDAEKLFEEIPALREQQEEIARTGADVRIRLEDWLTHPEMAEALQEHVRFDPLDMTQKEALGWQQDLEREVGNLQEVVAGAKSEADAAAALAREVRSQLLKVYPEQVAAPLVDFVVERYSTRAQRMGKSLQQLVTDEGLFRVEGPNAPVETSGKLPQTLEEHLGRLRDESYLLGVVRDMRAGRLPKVTRGTPLIDLLRSQGGVRTDSVLAGELANMGFKRSGKGSYSGLLSDKGRTDKKTGARREPIGDIDNLLADEHPEIAAVVGTDESGQYLNRQGLLDELAREMRGESRVVKPEEQQAYDAAKAEQAAVQAVLDEMQIPLDQADDAVVAKLTERFSERTFQEDHRGAIRMTDDLAEVVIRFTEAADLSTFLHESGHLFLAQLAKDAATDEGQLDADLATVKAWAKEKVGTDDVNSDAVQELWARSYEAYLFEGKAPTLSLERVFARFSAWLIRIYKRLRGIPGYADHLTPEIRGVMDRLLATDEAIAETAAARGLEALDAAALGMTPEQAADYNRTVEEGRAEAKRRLLPSLMEQARKQASKEWKALREGVRAEVETKVNARPVFQAQHWLRTGEALEGQTAPAVEHRKLDRAALVELYGKEITKVLGPALIQSKDGYHPDAVAELFGFPNGDDLVRSLAAAGRRQDVIEQEAEAETVRRHGTPETRDDVEAKALEALTNTKQLKALVMAERAVAAKAGGKVIPLALARASAERIVRGTRYRDLTPSRYRAAALKASREAVKLIAKGEFPEAQLALRHQITSLLMESEARKAIDQADRVLDHLHRVQGRKSWERIGKAGADYQEQIEGLLARFDLRRNQSLRKIDRFKGLAAWIAEQEAAGETVIVPLKLRDEAFRTSWKELSIEDLVALGDSVRNLEHLARRKNEFLANRERRQREAVQADLIAAVQANATPRNRPADLTPAKIEVIRSNLLDAESATRKMEFVVDLLDDRDPQGVWRANVFTPIAEAQAERYDLSREFTVAFAKMVDTLIQGRDFDTKWMAPEIGYRINRWNLIAIALNVGNDGNYSRLTDPKGNGFAPAAVQSLLDEHMTRADWDFVQATWKLIDSLWPRIAEQERRLTGVVPQKVTPRTVRTPFGEIEGGYYPIVYDPDKALFAMKQASKGLYEGLETAFQRAITGHGYTIERTNVAGPLWLDMAVIPSHLDQVIHDLTHREVLMQIDRLLDSKEIRAAFGATTEGDAVYKLFRPWLQGIAKDRIVENRSLSGVAKALRYVRTSSTSFALGLRETTLLMQIGGHSNAMGILKNRLPNYQRHLRAGLAKAMAGGRISDMKRVYHEVLEASGEMRHRIANLDRDLRDVIRRNQGKVNAGARVKTMAMELIGQVQMFTVDLPVWLGAYQGAVEELGHDHAQAVEFADAVVRMSQGAAGAKDLSAIQRADEGYRQFLTFFTYRNLVYNQVANDFRRTKKPSNIPDFLVSWAFFISIPFVYGALVRASRGSRSLPDDDAGPLDWLAWFFLGNFAEFAGSIPYAGDIGQAAASATGNTRYFASKTPTQRAGEAAADLFVPRDAVDFTFDALRIGALLTGLPADRLLKLTEDEIRGAE